MTESPATLFIDGAWVPSSTGETRTITCPADAKGMSGVNGDQRTRSPSAARIWTPATTCNMLLPSWPVPSGTSSGFGSEASRGGSSTS